MIDTKTSFFPLLEICQSQVYVRVCTRRPFRKGLSFFGLHPPFSERGPRGPVLKVALLSPPPLLSSV